MTNTWSNETVIEFINEVHIHPELWNVKTAVYKDRNAKRDRWIEIGEKFGITSDDAYKKFRSLRTYANNEEKKKKSGNAVGKPVKWFAFDAISFILTQNTSNTRLDNEYATAHVTETTYTDVSADQDDMKLETTEILNTIPKLRGKRSKNKDPLLEKAQNITRDDINKKRNEYAAFAEHITNKLSKYDDYTRAQAEFKIMQILFESDMAMHRNRASSTFITQSLDNNSRDGADTSQSQYSDTSD